METQHLTIMFTDIKGFTSRTSQSSRQQLHELIELHDNLIRPVFDKYNGRVIKTIGDAFLVTFLSPTDAVLCGIAIQKILEEYNKEKSDDRLEIRVAINSGEVAIKDNDIYGDAVNIAARLEGVAEAGDIYFTDAVYLSMNRSEIPSAEVGHRRFKGIPDEIKVYKVLQENKNPKSKKEVIKNLRLTKKENPNEKKLHQAFKWLGIIFVLLLIVILIIEIKKQKEEKEIFENNWHQSEEDTRNQQLWDEIQGIEEEIHRAARENDRPRVMDNLRRLHEINQELGEPIELRQIIRKLENLRNAPPEEDHPDPDQARQEVKDTLSDINNAFQQKNIDEVINRLDFLRELNEQFPNNPELPKIIKNIEQRLESLN